MARVEIVEELFDSDGALTSSQIKKTYTQKVAGEKFYIVFLLGMQNFFEIKRLSDVFVLAKLCALAEWNTGKVRLTTDMRKELCDELGLINSNLSRSLSNLKALNLISGNGADLLLDPRVFWKGELHVRKQTLKNLNITAWVEPDDEPKPKKKEKIRVRGPQPSNINSI